MRMMTISVAAMRYEEDEANALPQLLANNDVLAALTEMGRVLRPSPTPPPG
jgi:hypothetical protein